MEHLSYLIMITTLNILQKFYYLHNTCSQCTICHESRPIAKNKNKTKQMKTNWW